VLAMAARSSRVAAEQICSRLSRARRAVPGSGCLGRGVKKTAISAFEEFSYADR
jgi:hypothetical protein